MYARMADLWMCKNPSGLIQWTKLTCSRCSIWFSVVVSNYWKTWGQEVCICAWIHHNNFTTEVTVSQAFLKPIQDRKVFLPPTIVRKCLIENWVFRIVKKGVFFAFTVIINSRSCMIDHAFQIRPIICFVSCSS